MMFGQQPTAVLAACLAMLLLLSSSPAPAQDSGTGFITVCKPGYFGLSFDDGPSNNTGKLLDTLAAAQVKVTFFVLGNMLTPENSGFTQRAYNEGHQICSHTWDHKSLNTLKPDEITKEMKMAEDAIKNVTGVIPNYMRPPYGDCNAQCAATLTSLGYTVVTWNIDSNDWRYEDIPENWHLVSEDVMKIEDVNTTVTNNPQTGYISLQHDTLSFSVDQVPQIIDKIKALGLQIVPVAQCVDNPPAPMYRGGQIQTNQTSPAPSPGAGPAQPGPSDAAQSAPPAGASPSTPASPDAVAAKFSASSSSAGSVVAPPTFSGSSAAAAVAFVAVAAAARAHAA